MMIVIFPFFTNEYYSLFNSSFCCEPSGFLFLPRYRWRVLSAHTTRVRAKSSYSGRMLLILPFLFFVASLNAWHGFDTLLALNFTVDKIANSLSISNIQYATDGTFNVLSNSAFNFSEYFDPWPECSLVMDKASNMLHVTGRYIASYSIVSKRWTVQLVDYRLWGCALSQPSVLLCVTETSSQRLSMVFVNTQTGELKLSTPLPIRAPFSEESIVTTNGIYYAKCSDDPFLYSFNLLTGQLLSIVKLEWGNYPIVALSPMGITNGTMKLIGIFRYNSVYIVDTVTGSYTFLKAYNFDCFQLGPSVADPSKNVFYTSAFYFTENDYATKAYVISMADGSVLSELLLRDSHMYFYRQSL